jgi:Fe-S-cluster containining protein
MTKSHKKSAGALSARVRYREDEQKLPWLPALLDAYAIVDTGVAIAVRDHEKKLKVKLACARGCDVCCQQEDIPLYPHELVGLYWFVSEKMASLLRDVLKRQLAGHGAGSPCPFLIDHVCSVHPVRPASCRWFNVFTTPCVPDEDPYYTRRGDVLEPNQDYTDRAFAAVLSFYNMKKEGGTDNAVRTIRSQIMNLQTYDWKKMIVSMEKFDSRKP